jgi:O-antigen ligase
MIANTASSRAARPFGVRRSGWIGKLLLALVAAGLCVFCGLLAAVLPWWFVLIGLGMPMLAVVGYVWPFLGLLGVVVLCSGLVPSSLLPQVPLGPGKILGTDIALAMLLALALFKGGQRAVLALRLARPFLLPVAMLLLAIPLCSAIGYLLYGTTLKEVMGEARVQIYWAICLLPVILIYDMRGLHRVVWGVVLIGLALSVVVVLQFALGIQLLENARVEDLRTLGQRYGDITRSTAGGAIYLVVFALFYLVARLLTKTLPALLVLPLVAVLAAGVIVSFGRGIWLATGFGMLAIAWHLGGLVAVRRLAVVMLLGLVVALGALTAFKPRMIDAAAERFTSTFAEGANKSSLGDRLEENSYAVRKILTSPLIGIGFGTAYKPRLDPYVDWSKVRYIHNSYLGLWLKLGLLGLAAALLLVRVVFQRGWRMLRSGALDARSRAVATACLAGFFVPVLTGVTQPEWLAVTGITFFALMAGLLATLEQRLAEAPAGAAP